MTECEFSELGKCKLKDTEKVVSTLSKKGTILILTSERLLVNSSSIFKNDLRIKLKQIKSIESKMENSRTKVVPSIIKYLLLLAMVITVEFAVYTISGNINKVLQLILCIMFGIIDIKTLNFLIYKILRISKSYMIEVTQIICNDCVLKIPKHQFNSEEYDMFISNLKECTDSNYKYKNEQENEDSYTGKLYKSIGLKI